MAGKERCSVDVCMYRTAEQVQQEDFLMAELKKIEMRKKERERKQQDLQKLISAAEHNTERCVQMCVWGVWASLVHCRKGSVKKPTGSATKKLKSGASGHLKVTALVLR